MRYIACALALWGLPAAAEMTHLGSYVLERPEMEAFGGFSGIELSLDGQEIVAITDKGLVVEGQIMRQDGQITDVSLGPLQQLKLPDGTDTTPFLGDSEGLALRGEGIRIVSYEGWTRVREETGDGTPLPRLPSHPDFAEMQSNGSLEALAIDANGALYVIPERSGRALRPFSVYRLGRGAAQWEVVFQIERLGQLVPAGADIGPDGLLYLLERDFNGWGFSTRIRRFGLDGSGGEVLLETQPGTHDNLEGIAVWQDDLGLRITMVSDNNFRRFQRTELVEYRLTE